MENIDRVKQAFTEWREQRPGKCPIPDYLWDMVESLLNEYPRTMITKMLGISSSQLKNRFSGDELMFVEAVPNRVGPTPAKIQSADSIEQSCDIELKRPCDSTLKINALPVSVITTLIPNFVGQ